MAARKKGKGAANDRVDTNDVPGLAIEEPPLNVYRDIGKALQGITKILEGPKGQKELSIEEFRRMAPAFTGTTTPTEAESWIMDIEKILEVSRCDDGKKVAYAAFMFKEEAEHWWRMEKEVKRYPTIPMTWE